MYLVSIYLTIEQTCCPLSLVLLGTKVFGYMYTKISQNKSIETKLYLSTIQHKTISYKIMITKSSCTRTAVKL